MKRQYSFLSLILLSITFAAVISSCKDPFDVNDPQFGNSNQSQKFLKIAEASSSVNSFTPNYSEDQAMALTGTMGKGLYPVRIGQKMKLVDKNLTLVKDSTTAVGTLVQTFEGTLIIEGSFQQPTIGIRSHVDTTIQKNFSSTITRKIQFKRVANTGNDTLDWKVNAVSLPNGGTTGDNIQILRIMLTTQDGTEVVIEDPNVYFFKVGKDNKGHDHDDNDVEDDDDKDNHGLEAEFEFKKHGWGNLLTWYKKNQPVKLTVEVLSKSSDPDFLTVTYGAMMNGNTGTKEKFDLVSSSLVGVSYKKVYERRWYTNLHATRMHAVINALPKSVVYDTETSVEEKTWGIPYRVK